MVIFYILFIIANASFITQPYILGSLINDLQAGGDDLLSQTTFWLGIYVGLTIIFWMFHGPARIIERRNAFYVRRNFIMQQYKVLNCLPISWHNSHHSGNTINRVNKAALGLWSFSDFQFVYIEAVIRLAGSFIALTLISGWVASAVGGFVVIIIFIIAKFDKILVKQIYQADEREHVFSASFFDFVGNMNSLISFNLGSFSTKRLEKEYDHIAAPHNKSIAINEYKWGTMSVLIVIAEFCILFGYIFFHLQSALPIMVGTLVAIYQYMMQVNKVFMSFAIHYGQLVQYNTNFRAVDKIQSDFKAIGVMDEELPDLKVESGSIEFKNINFSYGGEKGEIIFRDFNLSIPAGQKVGLIGPSGAGKSTLISLLLRFHEAEEGKIFIDNQDIASINQTSLRDYIAVIPQDTSLFEDSLLANIHCGRLDADERNVIDAAKKAHAHEFISTLPEKYNTMVGERGVKLSGGQRQRIAISRAILKDAPILILDEATSALDSESERLIQSSLKDLMHGKTVIAIAHRLSTISHLDRLIVMNEGRIVEDGTHDDLLKRNGLYAKLWGIQSGGFLG
ncbi:MAG: ABC transporter ATP-binding protein [Alphaproteobacteria bacterium]|nr:ABC transporter ATP-binding protein [Alphaproteobacteria bacterium]